VSEPQLMSPAPRWRWLATAWRWLRAATGDDAYDNYLRHCARTHPEGPLLSRRAFYALEQERKWSGISRCC